MTKARAERNRIIKQDVLEQLDLGLSLKEAFWIVAERYWLSVRSIKEIYYNTRID